MKAIKIIFGLLGILLLSCDDGDIITVDLDFEDLAVQTCGNLVFYKEKQSPAETLSIQLNNTSLEQLLSLTDTNEDQREFSFNGNTNRLNYRSYSSLPDEPFCNDIPPAALNIISDDESQQGFVVLYISLVEDDNDGIPANLEDLNGNGDLNDDDSDGDGLPNFIDIDDDGDNVPTKAENPNYSEIDGLNLAQDSDEDGIPDYLDNDDDGDGVLTRDEENISQDQNPLNDVTFTEEGPDFLNPVANSTVVATALISHGINQTYTIDITLFGIALANLIQDSLPFGTYETTDSRSVTPVIN